MRSVILFGGIHDGLELEIKPGTRTVVLFQAPASDPRDLFPPEYYPVTGENLVTYSNTDTKNKEGRWIFQIV